MEKVCVNHPESPSVGSCKACEKPVCLMCITEVQGVSFCSDACGAAYQEVKDWLERPAAEEEWNPLAEGKPKAPAAKAPPAPAPEPVAAAPAAPEPKPSRTGGTDMRMALENAMPDDAYATIPQQKSEAPNRNPLYIAIAATILVLFGGWLLFRSPNEEKPADPIAKVDPPKVDPAKVDPPKPPPVKVEPVKVEPPKPEPVKVEPPKPPPPKPEPVKIEPPKPEPVKIEPPKPPPVKVEPPKPEPVKVEPPKPPPVKVEPPKPEPVKVEPPKPPPVVVPPPPPVKPEPAKVEPPKPPPVKPEPAKVEPPKPVEPPPAPHLAFLRDPWAKEKTGAWYRVKTVTAGRESYKDVGLRESGAGYRVLVSQVSADGKTEPEQFTWTEPEEVAVFGSVNGDVKGTKYAADVVRTKASKPSQFVFKDGPHAGTVFASDVTLAKLDSETVKVKERSIACSVMEAEPKDGKKGAKTWFSTQVPLGVVKWEGDGASSAIVDFGADWEKRPPFPATAAIAKVEPPKPPPVVPPPPPVKPEPAKVEPPKPPPPPPPKPEPAKVDPPKPPPPPPPVKPEPAKVDPPKPEPVKPEPAKVDNAKEEAAARAKKSIADAGALIKEASPMYGEVSGSMDSLPGDKASLRDLYRKAERCQLKLSDARILYSSVRGDAPDPAVIDRRVTQLDELLEGIRDCMKTIKSRIE